MRNTFDMAHAVETGETVNLTSEAQIPYTGLDSINNSKDTSGMGVTPIIQKDSDISGPITSRTAEDAIMLNIGHSAQVQKMNTQEFISQE